MPERLEAANMVRDAALSLSCACEARTPKSYRGHLDDTLREGVPDWARDLLNRMK